MTTPPVGGSLRDRVAALVPALRERAEAAEAARQVPAESMRELAAAGLFRALVPKSFGGDERPLSEVLEAVIEAAQGCSSTAWVGSLLAVHSLGLTKFDERVQREVWSKGPDALVVSSIAPMGTLTADRDGFRLRGRWSFVSGVDHGEWIMLGAAQPSGTQFALLPMSDCQIQDDWHVSGLKATGSKSVVVADAFVPAHRALPLEALRGERMASAGKQSAEVFRLPFTPVFNAAFPPVALGTALANLSSFTEYLQRRTAAVGPMSGQAMQTSPGHLMRLAQAATEIDSARALFLRNVSILERSVAASAEASPRLEDRLKYQGAFVVEGCRAAVTRLFRGSGGKALYTTSPLQRQFRDIHAISQHAVNDLDILGPIYGRALVEGSDRFIARVSFQSPHA